MSNFFASPLAFFADSRGDRLADSAYKKTTTPGDPQRWVYLVGTDEMASQVALVAGDTCRQVAVGPRRIDEYTHCFHFSGEAPYAVHETLAVLKEVLTLTRRADSVLDAAIALDFYKAPDPDLDPMHWPNTDAGELVNQGKYHGNARASWRLVDEMAAVITRHPLLRGASTIVSVPGHRADGVSFGEKLARHVAEKVGKDFVLTECLSGERPSVKESLEDREPSVYRLPRYVSGTVIVVDDVYWTGKSMNDVAAAARAAQAERVFGLAGARRMKRGV